MRDQSSNSKFLSQSYLLSLIELLGQSAWDLSFFYSNLILCHRWRLFYRENLFSRVSQDFHSNLPEFCQVETGFSMIFTAFGDKLSINADLSDFWVYPLPRSHRFSILVEFNLNFLKDFAHFFNRKHVHTMVNLSEKIRDPR